MQPHGRAVSRKKRRETRESGPFVLRSLLEDVPLSADGDREDIVINCVEFWGMFYECGGIFSATRGYILCLRSWLTL
jgi:hypothetical protein